MGIKESFVGLSIVSVFLISILASCGTSNVQTPSVSRTPVVSTKPVILGVIDKSLWLLYSINGQEFVQSRITMKQESNRIHGFAGCNNYFSQVSNFLNGQISLGPVGATKKMCSDQNNNIAETKFLQALGDVTNYQLDQDRLVLFGTSSELVFLKRSSR